MGIIQVTEGTSLGGFFRIFLPSIFCFVLFVFSSLFNLEEIKHLFSLSDIKFKQVILVATIALLLTYPIVTLGSNVGLTDFTIGMIIILGFFTSIYFIIVGKGSLGVIIFLLTFPFLSFFEYYYGGRYAFFGRIECGPIILTPTITFLLALFMVTVITQSKEESSRIFRIPVTKASLVFFILSFISSLCSKYPILSIKYFILMWVYPFLLFIVILRNIRTDNDLRLFSHTVIAWVCLISSLGLYLYFRSMGVISEIHNIYGATLPTNITSGIWGYMVAMVFPLSIVLFLLSKGRGRITYILVIGVLFVSMVLSFSRLPIPVTLVALLILLKWKKARIAIFTSVVILILIFVLFKPLLSDYIFYRFQHVRSFNDLIYDSSVQARWEGAKAALGMVKDHPLLGIGAGMWKDYVPYYAKIQNVVTGVEWGGGYIYGLGYIEDAHSLHLQVAADSGIPAFIAWISLLIMLFREGFYVLSKSKDQFRYHIALGVVSGLITFVVISIFGGLDLRLFLGAHFMFWIIVAIIVKLKVLEQVVQETEVTYQPR
jgi:putative inorganic carbon (HCO3(-)) transporter